MALSSKIQWYLICILGALDLVTNNKNEFSFSIKNKSYSDPFDFISVISFLAASIDAYNLKDFGKPQRMEISESTVEIFACILASHPGVILSKDSPFSKLELMEALSKRKVAFGGEILDISSQLKEVVERPFEKDISNLN